MNVRIKIRDDLVMLLYDRAKREAKKFEQLANELLSKALWNEPALLFKGSKLQVNNDLFGSYEPQPGDFEEIPQ
jgi:hypothetical protein